MEFYHSEKVKEQLESYLAKSLHGYYEQVCGPVHDGASSFKWLVRGDLSIALEGFLCIEQEQALSTRAMMQVYNQGSVSCCLCGEHLETVEHTVSGHGCSQQPGQQYKVRHDRYTYLHWLLCQKRSVECCTQWWQHSSTDVIDTSSVKILLDFKNIFCDRIISAR